MSLLMLVYSQAQLEDVLEDSGAVTSMSFEISQLMTGKATYIFSTCEMYSCDVSRIFQRLNS